LTVDPSLRDNYIVISHLLLQELRTFVTLQRHYVNATCHSFSCLIIHLSTFTLRSHDVRITEHFSTCTIDSTSRRRPKLPARPTETTPCLTTEMTVADPGALAGHPQLKAPGQHSTHLITIHMVETSYLPSHLYVTCESTLTPTPP